MRFSRTRQRTCSLKRDRYVVSRRRTGFGDCLWSLAAAWRYAQRTGRTLAIDWRGSCYLNQPFTNAFTVFFEPIQDIAGVRVICDDQINQFSFPGPFFPSWWNKPTIESVCRPDEQIFPERDELTELLQAQDDTDTNRVVSDACLMWRCDQAAERQIFQSLNLRPEIQARIHTIYQEHFKGRSIIGVHVRHGNDEDIMDHTPYWADPEFALRQVCTAIEKAKALPHRRPGFLVYGQRAGTGPFTGCVSRSNHYPEMLPGGTGRAITQCIAGSGRRYLCSYRDVPSRPMRYGNSLSADQRLHALCPSLRVTCY